MQRLLPMLLLVSVLLALQACAARQPSPDHAARPVPTIDHIDFSPVASASQVLLVIAEDDTQHATAWLLERQSATSTAPAPLQIVMGPLPACVGARGFAPPGQKREGDKRTPTGAFPIPESFAADPSFTSKLAHRVVTERDSICEDPASPNYNRWVESTDPSLPPWTPAEREMMQLGLIVDYNRDPRIPGAGSGILVHTADPGPATAGTYGCVGLHLPNLRAVVSRLDATQRPMILMGRRVDLVGTPAITR